MNATERSLAPGRGSSLRNERHRACVHAITLACWGGPIGEDVAQVRARLSVDHLRAHAAHEERAFLVGQVPGVQALDHGARDLGC